MLESPIALSLYHVTIGDQVPKPIAVTDIAWVKPLYAIERMPCVPSLYMFYTLISDHLRRIGAA